VFPGGDLVDEDLLVGYTAVETLKRWNAEVALGEIEPIALFGRVVPFEASNPVAGFGSQERLVERSLLWMLRLSRTGTMTLALLK
jgi:hypothetical protein